jgi:tetratricopeptide (TPR) repeat protein
MEYERPVRRAIDAVVRRARELGDERQQAARVFADLQAGRRRLDDLSSAEAALLRGVPVIDLLLEKSRAVRFRDPAEMVRLADLARLAAERLERQEPGRHGPAVLADLRARTWGELGNAYRVAGDFATAENALAQAASWARRGTGDLLLTARLGDLCASLCTDQGLFSEAARILHLVQAAYRSIGDQHLAGRALISKGLAVGHAGQPGPAVLAICDGLALIDPVREPELRLLGLHNLVYNLVEAGEHRRARMVLWQIRPLYEASGDALNLLRLRWLEGKIYFGLGEDATAEGHFEAVRKGFAARGQLYDTMLVGLDLAMLWARQGRRDEVRKLAAGLAESFRALRIARETLASLIMLREWCGCPWVPDGIIQDQIRIITALVNELDPEHPEQAAPRPHRRNKPRRFLHHRR